MRRKLLPTSAIIVIFVFLLPTLTVFTQTIQPVQAQNQTTFADDFSIDSNAWQYLGSAYRDPTNNNIVLTQAIEGQGGVALFKTPIKDSFTTNFSYKVDGGYSGDGFTMFFYKQPYTEIATGGNLGFNGWNKNASGCGVEFDSYLGLGDPSPNHVALIQDVFSNHLTYVNDMRVADGNWHSVRIDVQESGLKVFVDQDLVLQWTGSLNRTYDGFGFSAATGLATSYHLIDDFSVTYRTEQLQQPSLAISCKSSTSYSNFRVQINGNLTINGTGISGLPVLLSYSVTGGESWQDLTLVDTDSIGNYAAVWLPSVTGNYMLKAVFEGSEKYLNASTIVNFALEPNADQNVFSVTSNSTITGLMFDSAKNELSFNVSGTIGTCGYVIISIPSSLVTNISDLKVYVDNDQAQYSFDSQSDCWLLYLTYHHSTHIITVNLDSLPLTTEPHSQNGNLDIYVFSIVSAGIAIIATAIATAFRSWRKSQENTENTEPN
jgi:hypothetical protein